MQRYMEGRGERGREKDRVCGYMGGMKDDICAGVTCIFSLSLLEFFYTYLRTRETHEKGRVKKRASPKLKWARARVRLYDSSDCSAFVISELTLLKVRSDE